MVMLLTTSEHLGMSPDVRPSLNANRDLLLRMVEERLSNVIAALGLEVSAFQCSQLVSIENAHCRLILGCYENDHIVCRFEDKSQARFRAAGPLMQPFDLYYFLYMRLGGGVSEYVPRVVESGNDRRWLCLDGLGVALMDGELSAPLAGDFSWAGEYSELMAEIDGMYGKLVATQTVYRPEINGICRKWRMGDPSWVGDARDLLAQVGTRG
jgi:hypothetical protein